MAKKMAEVQIKPSAVETLRFQAHWGLKQLGHEDDMFRQLVEAEVDFIAELDLAHRTKRRWQILTDTAATGVPRIWSLARLWHWRRSAAWQLR